MGVPRSERVRVTRVPAVKEWILVAALGALAGFVAPRALWRPTRRAPRATPTAADVPAPTVAVTEDDDDISVAEAPRALSLADAPPDLVSPSVGARTRRGAVRAMSQPRGAPTDGLLTRRGSAWQLDLRGVSHPRALLSGLHLRPLADEGAGDGYRITRLDQRGLCARAGIQPGDVLIAVNGHPLRNADEALDAYVHCRGQRTFALRFRRGGGAYTVPVTVAGNVPLP